MTVPPLWAKPLEAKTRKKKEHICTCRKPKLKKKNLGKRKNLETTQKTQKTLKVIDKTLYKLVRDRKEKKFWHRAGNTSKNNSYLPHNHDSPSPPPTTTKTPTQLQYTVPPRQL